MNRWFEAKDGTAQAEDAFKLSDTLVHSKREQRAVARERRRSLPAAERRHRARRMALLASRLRPFLRARRIACYIAMDGEIDCAALIALIRRHRKQCYLPVLVKWPRRSLRFAMFRGRCRLKRNRLGIPEPAVPRIRLLSAERLDLVFTPLVGFDSECRRLGMGGGFYDRTLAASVRRARHQRPAVVGLAYELQRFDRVVADSWDVPLSHVVTERIVYRGDRNAGRLR